MYPKIAEKWRIRHLGEMFHTGNADTHDSLAIEVVNAKGVDKHVLRQISKRNRTQDAEGVDELLGGAGPAVGGDATQAGVDVGDTALVDLIGDLNLASQLLGQGLADIESQASAACDVLRGQGL